MEAGMTDRMSQTQRPLKTHVSNEEAGAWKMFNSYERQDYKNRVKERMAAESHNIVQ